MKIELRSRDKRALFGLAIAIAIYFGLSLIAVPAYQRIKTAADGVHDKEDELKKFRRAFANRDHYNQILEQARHTVADAEGHLIRGDNQSLAQVELQGIVEAAEQKVNIPPGQYTMSNAKKKDQYFNEITSSLSFECTPNQLVSFLAALRDSPKFVSIRNLQVAPVQIAFEAPTTKGEVKKTVRATLVVSAILPLPAASAPAPVAAPQTKG